MIARDDMHSVKKLFFVPVGLPGMGKSTLAKNMRLAIQTHMQLKQQCQLAAARNIQ